MPEKSLRGDSIPLKKKKNKAGGVSTFFVFSDTSHLFNLYTNIRSDLAKFKRSLCHFYYWHTQLTFFENMCL